MLKYAHTKPFYKDPHETKMWTDKGEAELKKMIEELKNSFNK